MLDTVIQSINDNTLQPEEDGLYKQLAPLYDFIYAQHYDYNAFSNRVIEATDETNHVVEYACGTGRLSAELETEFEHVTGIDKYASMVALGEQHTTKTNFYVDDIITAPLLSPRADCVTLLGNTLTHFQLDADILKIFDNAYSQLQPGGVFLIDYVTPESIKDGDVFIDEFEDGNFTVTRTVTFATHGSCTEHADVMFHYKLENMTTGETATTAEVMNLRHFDPSHVEMLLDRVGFDEVTREEGIEHDGVIIATK